MTPTGAESAALLDTSAAVALVVVDHEHHAAVSGAVRGRRLGLAGHAAFETFSVLTRLPPPLRRPPATVRGILAGNFPETRFLSREATERFFDRLVELGLGGGSVYDGLVAAAACEHGLSLVSCDRRAVSVYKTLGAPTELVE